MRSWFKFHLVREEMAEYPSCIQAESLATGERAPVDLSRRLCTHHWLQLNLNRLSPDSAFCLPRVGVTSTSCAVAGRGTGTRASRLAAYSVPVKRALNLLRSCWEPFWKPVKARDKKTGKLRPSSEHKRPYWEDLLSFHESNFKG